MACGDLASTTTSLWIKYLSLYMVGGVVAATAAAAGPALELVEWIMVWPCIQQLYVYTYVVVDWLPNGVSVAVCGVWTPFTLWLIASAWFRLSARSTTSGWCGVVWCGWQRRDAEDYYDQNEIRFDRRCARGKERNKNQQHENAEKLYKEKVTLLVVTGIEGRLGILTEEKQGGSLVKKARSGETKVEGQKCRGQMLWKRLLEFWNCWKLLMDLGN